MTAASDTVDLSVVIPTRDRVAKLAETLDALDAARRRGEARFETIVVDDGSRDVEAVRALCAARAELLEQPPRGPAAARNRGVAASRAARVLFLGDDTRPAPGALAEHLRLGERDREPVAVQGHIDWDPEREITPLMRFLAPAGPQFYFRGLVDGEPIPFTAVLGSNLSAPKEWLEREPFDESFPHAALEDTELAWRWRVRGWTTVYARGAVCWHHHRYDTLEPFLERQRRAGRSARHALARHPRLIGRLVLEPAFLGMTLAAARRLRGLLTARLGPAEARPSARARARDAAWDLACRRAFLRGLLSG